MLGAVSGLLRPLRVLGAWLGHWWSVMVRDAGNPAPLKWDVPFTHVAMNPIARYVPLTKSLARFVSERLARVTAVTETEEALITKQPAMSIRRKK